MKPLFAALAFDAFKFACRVCAKSLTLGLGRLLYNRESQALVVSLEPIQKGRSVYEFAFDLDVRDAARPAQVETVFAPPGED